MQGKSLEVDAEYGHCEGYTGAPENVGNDDGPESVLWVWENGRNDAARG